jgi:uncharacterized membrane protein YdjX (TVP38/TMEM64 family)
VTTSRTDARAATRRRLQAAVVVVLVAGVAVALALWGDTLWRLLGDRDRFRAWLESYGRFAAAAFVATQLAQVVLFFIPGEVTQVAGGYVFGTSLGLALSLVGIGLGSLIAFGLGRLFDRGVLELLVPPARLARFEALLRRRVRVFPLFMLFLTPGVPKDLLCYVAGLTPIPLLTFMVMSMIGRLPGVVLSSVFGSGLAERDWPTVAISGGVSLSLVAVVWIFRGPIERWQQRWLPPEAPADG